MCSYNILVIALALTGKAEATYDVLPMEVKATFKSATDALRDRLQPVKREALKSAELIKRRQMHSQWTRMPRSSRDSF